MVIPDSAEMPAPERKRIFSIRNSAAALGTCQRSKTEFEQNSKITTLDVDDCVIILKLQHFALKNASTLIIL